MENAIIIYRNDFKNLVNEIVNEVITEMRKDKSLQAEAPMGVKEVCKFIKNGCHPNTVYRKMKKGLPFHTDPDGEIYFYASEINEWLNKKKS